LPTFIEAPASTKVGPLNAKSDIVSDLQNHKAHPLYGFAAYSLQVLHVPKKKPAVGLAFLVGHARLELATTAL
jgi:hypothetical protein